MISLRAAWICLLVCALIGVSFATATAAGEKLLVVVLDKVTWHDLLAEHVNAPTIRELAEDGSVGLMCIRSARGYGGQYVTLGAGSRASSVLDLDTRCTVEGHAYMASESVEGTSAGRVYGAVTGRAVGGNAICHLALGQLLRQNTDVGYPLQLGLLGGELRRAGLRVACVGNADTLTCKHREAVAIAMDEDGLVPLGEVGDRLITRDSSYPAGVRVDREALLSAFRRAVNSADVIVFDPGETARIEYSAERMPPPAAAKARVEALALTDALLAEALRALPRDRWAILVITPTLRGADPGEGFDQLAPVIWCPPGGGSHLLTSPSTRRPGLVVNTDIASSILAHFGLPAPADVVGRPMQLEASPEPALVRLEADLRRHDAVEGARRAIFRAWPITAAIALWVAAFFLLVGERVPRVLRLLLRGLLVVILSVPAATLLVALRSLPASHILAGVLGLSLVLAYVSGWFTVWRSGHVLPMLLVVGLLAYDLARGQGLLAWSPLSYSPAAGARFYGIGNELGGVLLGAALLGAASVLWPRERSGRGERVLVGLALIGLAVLVGLPQGGANLGMSLAFIVGATVFCLYLWREEWGWVEALSVIGLGISLLAAAIVVELAVHGTEASHIGRLISTVRAHGLTSVTDVFARKLAMNWLLVRVSLWTDVAAAALGVLGVVVAARPRRVLVVLRERSWLGPGLIACCAGAVAAFLVNDSGIVAASLALVYAAGSVAYVSLGDVGLEESY